LHRKGRAIADANNLAGLIMFVSVVPLGHMCTIHFNGNPITARQGETVAACLLRAGVTVFRRTPVSDAPRLPYCMIGHCFDCLVEIDGQGSRQACLVHVEDGMRVWPQHGAAAIPGDL
jgi:predicted molibdopterin-dependent oxidoreductase YjgC